MQHRFVRRWLFAVLGLVIVIVFSIVRAVIHRRASSSDSSKSTFSQTADPRQLARELGELRAKEDHIDETVWAKERLAERCGETFEALWNSLNAATNKLDPLSAFQFEQLIFGQLSPAEKFSHFIETHQLNGVAREWNPSAWRDLLRQRQEEGWRLSQTEFRHNAFDTDTQGRPLRSTFYFSAHLTNLLQPVRASLEGNLVVDWKPASPKDAAPPAVARIDATRLLLKTRTGEPAFHQILNEQIAPPDKSYFIDPLIVYDLDGDGFSEIVLAASNLVFRHQPGGKFQPEALCQYPPGLIFTAVIADFDGDGTPDFLCAKFEGLVLFRGTRDGRFDQAGQSVWTAVPRLKYAQALTCGDVDGDGDLDLWLGQYKVPYERGQMPIPYYDANDGNPGYLLRNDGHGNFSDGTSTAGLEKKRWRRCYSASLTDLDDDGDLDLVTISDFAGADLFTNDGRGHFTDVTRNWLSEPRGFGMAHALADFNADGRLDLLMIGMNSPTADRLNHSRTVRESRRDDVPLRNQMVFGNRLFLRRADRLGFEQTAFNESIARSGWAWGCSAFDFDNDGFADVYIANGHETNQSVRDYEPEFWLHDIYVGAPHESVIATAYFTEKLSRTRGVGYSYGGYEKNRLYYNRRGGSFLEIAHLMEVALEEDSRNVVADDLDGDGRMDLLVTTFKAWPKMQQTLRVFKNVIADPGNWIGLRLRETGHGASPVGARVFLKHANGQAIRQIVAGDSYRSQHPNTIHFGVGAVAQIEEVEIRWPNGRSTTVRHPSINQYHTISSPPDR